MSEERMSALEKAMRERAERCAGYSGGMDKEADGAAKGYAEAADLVAQRDAQLRVLVDEREAEAADSDIAWAYRNAGAEHAARLRAILEGKEQ